ncbi:MAG: cytochrome b/b6 domain-containing protein [Nevskiaceae bacterium]|nr:MAG: cytochrome b/b6 domain-containing protein [Nevskiaceae bacterium]TBR74641.1 MAG: cytochrome b/b6 domain-containing protein [Nevskiaceae bacterium]
MRGDGPNAARRSGLLRRHGRTVRIAHGVNALAVIVLLVTGLALGDRLTAGIEALLGGHEAINGAHRLLGLAFAVAVVGVPLVAVRRVAGLIRDVSTFRRGDGRWFPAFLSFYRQRGQGEAPCEAPFHDGRFDPAQRVALLCILACCALLAASGVYMYWMPDWGRALFVIVINAHVYAAWVLMACLVLHIAAGLGVPRTHRGLARAMFGDGRVPVSLARSLWPGWARRRGAAEAAAADRVNKT